MSSQEIKIEDVPPGSSKQQLQGGGARRKEGSRTGEPRERSESSGLSRADGLGSITLSDEVEDMVGEWFNQAMAPPPRSNVIPQQQPPIIQPPIIQPPIIQPPIIQQPLQQPPVNPNAGNANPPVNGAGNGARNVGNAPRNGGNAARNRNADIDEEYDNAAAGLNERIYTRPPPPDNVRCIQMLPNGERCLKKRSPYSRLDVCSRHDFIATNGAKIENHKKTKRVANFAKNRMDRQAKFELERANVNKFLVNAERKKGRIADLAAQNDQVPDVDQRILNLLN